MFASTWFVCLVCHSPSLSRARIYLRSHWTIQTPFCNRPILFVHMFAQFLFSVRLVMTGARRRHAADWPGTLVFRCQCAATGSLRSWNSTAVRKRREPETALHWFDNEVGGAGYRSGCDGRCGVDRPRRRARSLSCTVLKLRKSPRGDTPLFLISNQLCCRSGGKFKEETSNVWSESQLTKNKQSGIRASTDWTY